MRTTIELDDEVLAEAKRMAIASGRSLAAVVEDALRDELARQRVELERQRNELAQQRARVAKRRTQPPRLPFRLPTYPGWGLRPGLDLDDMASVLDFLDDDNGSS
jgi:Arc/MetJ family transcription regulator